MKKNLFPCLLCSLFCIYLSSCVFNNPLCPCVVVSAGIQNQNGNSEYLMLGSVFEILNRDEKNVSSVNIEFDLFSVNGNSTQFQNRVEVCCEGQIEPGSKRKFTMSLDNCVNGYLYKSYEMSNITIQKVEFENGEYWLSSSEKIKEKILK